MDSTIYHVLKSKSIVSYLEKKGNFPFKSLSNGRLSYLCPFPDHNESKPSFVVWTNSEFENFHCFGCQRGYSIIHLVSGLEGITYKAALQKLSEGMEISLEEDIKLELELLSKKLNTDASRLEIAQKLYAVGTQCRFYLQGVDYDQNEVKLVDGFLSNIDKCIRELDFDSIDNCGNHLPKILRLRRIKFERERKQRRINEIRNEV